MRIWSEMVLENKLAWIKLRSLLWRKIAQLGYALSNTKCAVEAHKKSLIPAEVHSESPACFEC